jgi:hypothetical protein
LKAIANSRETEAQSSGFQLDSLLIVRLADSFHSLSIDRSPTCDKLQQFGDNALLLNRARFWIILTVGVYRKFPLETSMVRI